MTKKETFSSKCILKSDTIPLVKIPVVKNKHLYTLKHFLVVIHLRLSVKGHHRQLHNLNHFKKAANEETLTILKQSMVYQFFSEGKTKKKKKRSNCI